MSAIPSPGNVSTFLTGHRMTADDLNKQFPADTFLLGGSTGSRPSFRSYGTGISVANGGGIVNVLPTTCDVDTDLRFSSGVYTVSTSGLWVFSISLGFPMVTNNPTSGALNLLATSANDRDSAAHDHTYTDTCYAGTGPANQSGVVFGASVCWFSYYYVAPPTYLPVVGIIATNSTNVTLTAGVVEFAGVCLGM